MTLLTRLCDLFKAKKAARPKGIPDDWNYCEKHGVWYDPVFYCEQCFNERE